MEMKVFEKEIAIAGWVKVSEEDMISIKDNGKTSVVWVAKIPYPEFVSTFTRAKYHDCILRFQKFKRTADGCWAGSDAQKLLSVIGSTDANEVFDYLKRNKLWI